MFSGKLRALCLMSIATITRGALWESDNWALSGTMNGGIGYDSNLTLSRDGPNDFLVVANPFLTMTRRNSVTDFTVNGGVTQTEFINHRLPTETDYSFDAVYAYPSGDNVIPIYRAEASWTRSAQPNQYLGARVPHEAVILKSEGYLPVTGKLGLRASANFTSDKYKEDSLNDTTRGQAFLGLAYKRLSTTEISLNLGAALAHTKPNDPAFTYADIHGREFYLTARMEGQITAKISGSIYGGYGQASYTGGYTHTNNLPVGGADLTWGFDPRRTLVLAAYRSANFSPDGSATTVTHAFLSFTHVIADQWQYILRGGPTHVISTRQIYGRTDNSWDFGTEFAYKPSDRFRVALALTYTKQSSNNFFNQFTRQSVTFGATYAF